MGTDCKADHIKEVFTGLIVGGPADGKRYDMGRGVRLTVPLQIETQAPLTAYDSPTVAHQLYVRDFILSGNRSTADLARHWFWKPEGMSQHDMVIRLMARYMELTGFLHECQRKVGADYVAKEFGIR